MQKSTWSGLVTLVTLAASSALAGCAVEGRDASSAEDEPAAAAADLVGVTDLGTLEQSLGLKLATTAEPGDVQALRAGACYRALIASGDGATSFEFRRYSAGAAFWAKKGSGYNSGDQRPVLCVDLHRADAPVSLSGVALDAVLRYDFGAFVGQDSGMQKTHLVFQRGVVHLSRYDVSAEEQADSVRRRPHERPFEHASTIAGRLSSLTIKGVTTDVMFEGEAVRDLEMDGDVAHLVYRHAWRKAEDSGRFMLDEDAVGAFARRASVAGDGPGYGEIWRFARGEVAFSRVGEDLGEGQERTVEEITVRAVGAPADRAPLADCTRVTRVAEAPPAYRCTGI